MKKTSILIAVVAVIAASSATRAEVDFNGKGFKSMELSQAIQKNSFNDLIPLPKPSMEIMLNSEKHAKKARFYNEQGHLASSINVVKKVIINETEIGELYKWAISSDKKIYSVGIPRSESDFKDIGLKYGGAKLVFPENKNVALVCRWILQAVASGLVWDGVKWVTKYTYEKVKVCEPAADNPGSGSTYHNGQGGSSNYDVNKHLNHIPGFAH